MHAARLLLKLLLIKISRETIGHDFDVSYSYVNARCILTGMTTRDTDKSVTNS